jgi:hypothetical protein
MISDRSREKTVVSDWPTSMVPVQDAKKRDILNFLNQEQRRIVIEKVDIRRLVRKNILSKYILTTKKIDK